MTAKEIKDHIEKGYLPIDNLVDLLISDRESYAESLAKERSVKFIMNELGIALKEDVAEILYDTFLAEKRKEGAE